MDDKGCSHIGTGKNDINNHVEYTLSRWGVGLGNPPRCSIPYQHCKVCFQYKTTCDYVVHSSHQYQTLLN